MDSIRSLGLQGISRGLTQVQDSSRRIVDGFANGTLEDVATDIVGLKSGELQVYASSKVLQVNEQLEDTVLNIIA